LSFGFEAGKGIVAAFFRDGLRTSSL
jgi:hypothetical protein